MHHVHLPPGALWGTAHFHDPASPYVGRGETRNHLIWKKGRVLQWIDEGGWAAFLSVYFSHCTLSGERNMHELLKHAHASAADFC